MKFQRKKIAIAMFAGGALSALVAAPAMGQTAAGSVTAPGAGQQPIRVEVTGSNIRRVDAETASPIQVLTQEDLAKSGYTTISEVLRDVTANGQGLLSQGFNGAFAGGASGVALRGLGVGATLVLIDGFRTAPYPLPDDGQRGFTDISSIPFSAVERIEILLDGASAIYGSDAIGGVVNVILKKNFTGSQFIVEGGTTAEGDGNNIFLSFTQGFGDASGKYSGLLAVEYRKQDEIKFQDREGEDWARTDWSSFGGTDLRPGARSSLNTNPILRTPYLQRPGADTNVAANNAFLNSANSSCNLALRNANQCLYDNTWSTIQPDTQNINVLGRFNAKFAENWELNLTGSWFNSEAEQNRRPFAVPAGSAAPNIISGPGIIPSLAAGIPVFQVPASYPGNTLGVPAIVRALVPDISNQSVQFETSTLRLIAEVNGSGYGWDFNIAGGYTKAESEIDRYGYVDFNVLLAELSRPVNPFLLTGGNPSDVVGRISPTVSNKPTNELSFFQATASRDLMKLEGGFLGLAVGASYVYQKLDADNPQPCKDGTVAGINCFYAVGNQANTAVFAEINAPVLKTLELSAALRYDYYDTYGGQTVPKVGFKWTPIKEVGVRGTWGQGFRAPYIAESGTAGLAFSAGSLRDPLNCPVSNANGTPNLTSPQNVPATCSFTPTYLQTTNPDLEAEKSDNWTIGLVLEPVQNWLTTFDYYSIEVKNQILPATNFASFDTLGNIVRGPVNSVTFGNGTTGPSPAGLIAYINDEYVNAGKTTTTGLDFGTSYAFKLPDASTLKLGAQWSHIFTYDIEYEGVKYEIAGTHGPAIISGNTGNPEDRVQLTAQWQKGPFIATLMGNYTSSFSVLDPSSGNNTCNDGAAYGNPFRFPASDVPDQYCNVDEFWFWNLNLSWQINKQAQVRFAVTNLFNQQAPVDVGTYAGTGDNRNSSRGAPYNPSLHWSGVVGTSFLLGLTYQF